MKYNKIVDDVIVTTNEDVSEEVIRTYIAYVKTKHHGRSIQSISLDFDGRDVGIGYYVEPEHFEKIRRITGYLVGDMNRWNDGKTAEERDRVKHGISK